MDIPELDTLTALVTTYKAQHVDPADTSGNRKADEFLADVQAETERIRATGRTSRPHPATRGVNVHQVIDVVAPGSTVIGYQGNQ
jgi:hypothetical protein